MWIETVQNGERMETTTMFTIKAVTWLTPLERGIRLVRRTQDNQPDDTAMNMIPTLH
jgi:hypothetical protein